MFPTQCLPGTFLPLVGQVEAAACQPCPAGTVCPFYGARHSDTAIYCEFGHACPAGTKWKHELACPAGTYSDVITLTDTAQCLQCPEKFACPQRTGFAVGSIGSNALTNPKLTCATGHYCPAGTASPTALPCAAGTYSPEIDNHLAAQCLVCPAGRYCTGGQALPSGPCAEGHYCPTGSSSATSVACPAGSYFNYLLGNGVLTGARAAPDCRVCPPGHYCPAASASPTQCAPGTYGRVSGLQAGSPSGSQTGCAPCPAGWQCPSAGTIDPTECGAGRYSGDGASSCP